jgi:DNA-binding MarR family transcriptional regulator
MTIPCFCTNLRLATRRVSAIYDAALAPLGVNIAQYFLLRTLDDHMAMNLTELGQRAELDRSTVGRNVRVLERMGLAVSGRGDKDQREAVVSLTTSGSALVRDALPIWERCQQDMASRLGADKLGTLTQLLVAA